MPENKSFKKHFNYYNLFIALAGLGAAAVIVTSVFIALGEPVSAPFIKVANPDGTKTSIAIDPVTKTANTGLPVTGIVTKTGVSPGSSVTVYKTKTAVADTYSGGQITRVLNTGVGETYTDKVHPLESLASFSTDLKDPTSVGIDTKLDGSKVLRVSLDKSPSPAGGDLKESLLTLRTVPGLNLESDIKADLEVIKTSGVTGVTSALVLEPKGFMKTGFTLEPDWGVFVTYNDKAGVGELFLKSLITGTPQRISLATGSQFNFAGQQTLRIRALAGDPNLMEVLWNGVQAATFQKNLFSPPGDPVVFSIYVSALVPPGETADFELVNMATSLKTPSPGAKIEAVPVTVQTMAGPEPYDGRSFALPTLYDKAFFRETTRGGVASYTGVVTPPRLGPVCGDGVCEPNEHLISYVTSWATDSTGGRAYISGGYAYVANALAQTFEIYNISNPALRNLVVSIPMTESPLDVFVSGDFAYVVGANNLYVYNIVTTPPLLTATLPNLNAPIFVYGSKAYVGAKSLNQVDILDLFADPGNPAVITSVLTDASGVPGRIFVEGNYLYVTTGSIFQIWDISNPASPVFKSSTTTGAGISVEPIRGLSVQSGFVYLLSEGALPNTLSLKIYNANNPLAPISQSGSEGVDGNPIDLNVFGSEVYLLSKKTVGGLPNTYLERITLDNPLDPRMLSSTGLVAGAAISDVSGSLQVLGQYAYARVGNTLQFFNIAGTCPADCSGPVGVATSTVKMAAIGSPGPGQPSEDTPLPAIVQYATNATGDTIFDDLGIALLTVNTNFGDRKITLVTSLPPGLRGNKEAQKLETIKKAAEWGAMKVGKMEINGYNIDYVLGGAVSEYNTLTGTYDMVTPAPVLDEVEIIGFGTVALDGTVDIDFTKQVLEAAGTTVDLNLKFTDLTGTETWDTYKVTFIETAPPDQDGDGVPDPSYCAGSPIKIVCDECPDTAQGAEIDYTGCSQVQRDADLDGVCNFPYLQKAAQCDPNIDPTCAPVKTAVTPAGCGDGVCDKLAGEDATTCPADCGGVIIKCAEPYETGAVDQNGMSVCVDCGGTEACPIATCNVPYQACASDGSTRCFGTNPCGIQPPPPPKEWCTDGPDACPDKFGTLQYQGCPVAAKNIFELHILDKGTTKDKCYSMSGGLVPVGTGSCKLPISGLQTKLGGTSAEKRVFNRNDQGFQALVGRLGVAKGIPTPSLKNPPRELYPDIFEASVTSLNVGLVGSCVPDRTGICYAGLETPIDGLDIVKVEIPLYTSGFTLPDTRTAYGSRLFSPTDFVNNTVEKYFQFVATFWPKQYPAPSSGWSPLVFSQMRKISGSYLEILAPDYTIWQNSTEVYPFLFYADSDWAVDVCMDVPTGYKILEPGKCEQALVAAGAPADVLFVLQDVGSPRPDMKAHMKIRHKGKTYSEDFEIPGKRKGKDR